MAEELSNAARQSAGCKHWKEEGEDLQIDLMPIWDLHVEGSEAG